MSSETLKGLEPVAWMFDQPKLNIYNWTTTLKAECERGENIRPLHTADQLAQVVQQRDGWREDAIISKASIDMLKGRIDHLEADRVRIQSELNAEHELLCHERNCAADLKQQRDELAAAAQAVIDRWETPLWKNVPATAEYIYALRDVVAKVKP